MSGFDDRQKGFENKFKHDQELQFKVTARRNKLVGQWVAAKFGLAGEAADAYAKEVVAADFDKPGDDDVIEKIQKDAGLRGVHRAGANGEGRVVLGEDAGDFGAAVAGAAVGCRPGVAKLHHLCAVHGRHGGCVVVAGAVAVCVLVTAGAGDDRAGCGFDVTARARRGAVRCGDADGKQGFVIAARDLGREAVGVAGQAAG